MNLENQWNNLAFYQCYHHCCAYAVVVCCECSFCYWDPVGVTKNLRFVLTRHWKVDYIN